MYTMLPDRYTLDKYNRIAYPPRCHLNLHILDWIETIEWLINDVPRSCTFLRLHVYLIYHNITHDNFITNESTFYSDFDLFWWFVMLTPTSKILMWNNKSLCINKILAATYFVSYMVNKTSLSFYIVLKDYNFFYTFLFIHMNMYIAQQKPVTVCDVV